MVYCCLAVGYGDTKVQTKPLCFQCMRKKISSKYNKYNEQVSTEASKGCLERQRIGTELLANLNSLSTDHALSILVVHLEVLKKAFRMTFLLHCNDISLAPLQSLL